MKEKELKVNKLLLLSTIFVVLFFAAPGRAGVDVSVGIGANFSELNEYGEWVHVEGLGRVWRPYADEGWRPFTYGRWVYSNDGWLWDSDEPFGWIVCHYGNWYEDEDRGWVWMPGYEWSPARVEWYVTDNEIAWAPKFPPGHHHRFSRVHWSFCPIGFFTSGEMRSHVNFRLRPEHHEPQVRVYAHAPEFDFVQRFYQAPIVRVTPRRTEVSNREHPLFKIEIGDHHNDHYDAPVGPRFRRDHDRPAVIVEPGEEHHRTTVVVEPREQRHNTTVVVQPREERHNTVIVEPREEHRSTVVVQPREDHERARVEVFPRGNDSERKVRVETRDRNNDRDNNGRNNGDDNNREKKRVRVEVNN
jgi:hypothetical protein